MSILRAVQIGAIPLYFPPFKLTSIFFCLTRNMIEVYVCLVESHSCRGRNHCVLQKYTAVFPFLSTTMNVSNTYVLHTTGCLRQGSENVARISILNKIKGKQKQRKNLNRDFFPGVMYFPFLMRILKASIIAKTFMLNLI